MLCIEFNGEKEKNSNLFMVRVATIEGHRLAPIRALVLINVSVD